MALRNSLLCTGLLIGVAACAPTMQPVSSETTDQGLRAFDAGQANLSCGDACAGVWRRSQPELTTLYGAGDWDNLAVRVLQINHREDLAYYYLGRSAEGLGRRSAALVYYRAAADLARGPDADSKCITAADHCAGLSLLREDLLRIQIVSEPHGSALQGRTLAARGSSQERPAPPGGWVDPPPVNP